MIFVMASNRPVLMANARRKSFPSKQLSQSGVREAGQTRTSVVARCPKPPRERAASFSPKPINSSRHFHFGVEERRKPVVSLRDRKTLSHFHPRSAWWENGIARERARCSRWPITPRFIFADRRTQADLDRWLDRAAVNDPTLIISSGSRPLEMKRQFPFPGVASPAAGPWK